MVGACLCSGCIYSYADLHSDSDDDIRFTYTDEYADEHADVDKHADDLTDPVNYQHADLWWSHGYPNTDEYSDTYPDTYPDVYADGDHSAYIYVCAHFDADAGASYPIAGLFSNTRYSHLSTGLSVRG